mgnify:CR=1 FL=1
MTRKLDGSPIPRHLIFVLRDGSFVVQWDAEHVQDMFTGTQRPFRDAEYGHAITDFELETLRDSGRVAHFDRAYVWLHALPEGERFAKFRTREKVSGRVKRFYLNTTLPGEYLQQVQSRLQELGLQKWYTAREQSGLVAIVKQDGRPFTRLAEAEAAQNMLRRAAPQLLKDAAVAFMEFNTHRAPPGDDFNTVDVLDLDTLIASQTQTFTHEHKIVVGVDQDEDFLSETAEIMNALGVEFFPVTTGQKALHTIEDLEPDLVLMDLVLPDTHAWEILAKMKANQALAKIPVIIVSALGTQADQVFALTVAKVSDYLVKPVAPGRLRQSVWAALKSR